MILRGETRQDSDALAQKPLTLEHSTGNLDADELMGSLDDGPMLWTLHRVDKTYARWVLY